MKGRGRHYVWISVALALLCAPAAASAQEEEPPISIGANSSSGGVIDVLVSGPIGASVRVGELINGVPHELTTLTLLPPGVNFAPSIERWRCDRLTRRFYASRDHDDGTTETVTFDLRTPSCAKRLKADLPRRARVDTKVKLRLRDSWKLGGIRPRLCIRPPDRPKRCRTLRLRDGKTRLSRKLKLTRLGTWKVSIRTRRQLITRRIEVGRERTPEELRLPTVLLTGDSMMQTLDLLLRDGIEPDADVESDVLVGTGISKIDSDWIKIARGQRREFKPKGTVVFLGTNDGIDMKTPEGVEVACCDQPWINEYARRVEKMMRAYRRTVLYLTLPTVRDPRRQFSIGPVNTAIKIAASRVPKAHVLDLVPIFTPGNVYRDSMPYRGREVEVRADDGVHLSVKGSKIAARIVIRELRRLKVLAAD